MISDKDYRDISKVVYDVDLLKAPKTPLIQDTPVVNGSFIIIEPPVDTGNGMQAMAVAPIKVTMLTTNRFQILPTNSLF
ncbi:hypothetical protein ACTGZQ_09315 [Streptococcus suis]